MAFEDLEVRTAAAGLRHIGNCDVVIDGSSGRGIFDAEGGLVINGLVETTGPQVQVLSSLAPAAQQETAVSITRKVNGVPVTTAYTVTAAVPDGTGFTTYQLHLAT